MITRNWSGQSCTNDSVNSLHEQEANVRRIAFKMVMPAIIAVGILGNILNVLVLTRPFLKGATRIFLLALAISDLSVMVTVIPMALRLNMQQSTTHPAAFFHAHFEIFLSNVFIGSSVFIVVCLTIERYFSVCLPTVFRSVHTKRNACKAALGCYLTSAVISLPLAFLKQVCRASPKDNCESWGFQENKSVTATIYWTSYLYFSECAIRFGPCLILATLNILIIRKFRQIGAKRKLLRDSLTTNETDLKTLKNKRYQEEKRLIRLLRAIVLLFFITITPSAILSLIYSENNEKVYWFQVFRAVANNLELANFALNFYVYCLCSREFRSALMKMFTSCNACEDSGSEVDNNEVDFEDKTLKSIRITDFESGSKT